MSKTDLLREKFQHELSDENKNILVEAFNTACKHALYAGNGVFLETFGLFTSVPEKKSLIALYKGNTLSRQVRLQNIQFQKCSELTSYIRERNEKIIEEKELCGIVLSKLPLNLQIEWRLEETREFVSGLIQSIKHDTISLGICRLVTSLGDFFSLHNRQGSNLDDWYAGSNIIFRSNCSRESFCEDCRVFERAVLQNTWELMECVYGKALHIFSINICKELKNLGFDLDLSYFKDGMELENIQVAVYANKNAKQQQLIYCTDGLRNLGMQAGHVGNEFVFQVAYDSDFRDSAKNSASKLDDILLPSWPKAVLLMGWIMLLNSKTKSVSEGAALSLKTSLCTDITQSRLSAVICTNYSLAKVELLSNEGPFNLINLLGITNEEYKLSENYAADILITLLKEKRLDQVTKLCRPNLLTKTSFLDMTDSGRENQVTTRPKDGRQAVVESNSTMAGD
jgi:hypothetical protein